MPPSGFPPPPPGNYCTVPKLLLFYTPFIAQAQIHELKSDKNVTAFNDFKQIQLTKGGLVPEGGFDMDIIKSLAILA